MKSRNKINLAECLDLAEKYEKQGEKKLAKKYLEIAERFELIMKKNKESYKNREIIRGRKIKED